ncbi:MAG: hypothetical protein ACK4RX_01870 [Chitinophagaceae bacterium]
METTNYQPSTINQQSSDEISLKELIQKIGDWYRYLKTQWWKIAIAGIIGGALGFVYAWMQPITYTAKTTFVVEDAKSGPSLGGLASLAGQFGVDVGGGGGGGLIAGDNILLYFKSESLAREVLLSPWDSAGKQSLADRYILTHGLQEKWAENKRIGNISFQVDLGDHRYTRLQDSLLQVIISGAILKKQFSINKIDKKAGFIQLSVTMQDEALARIYCDRLVDIAVKRYVALKTERQQKTVDKLQARVDSISNLLNRKTSASAALQTAAATMDVNPLYRTNTAVASELTTRDKTMLATVYGEVVKNLELAKFTLSQETPVIQIVDKDNYPLIKNKMSKLKSLLLGAIFVIFVSVSGIIISRKVKSGLL